MSADDVWTGVAFLAGLVALIALLIVVVDISDKHRSDG